MRHRTMITVRTSVMRRPERHRSAEVGLFSLALMSTLAASGCPSAQHDDAPAIVPDARVSVVADAGGGTTIDEGEPATADAGVSPEVLPPDGAVLAGPFNPPGAKLVYVGQGPSGGLEIIASNLRSAESGGHSSQDWLVAVRNSGPDPICSVGVNADFKSANGSNLLTIPVQMNIDGEAYLDKGSPANCIGPGKIGLGVYPLSTVSRSVDATSIARIEHGFPGVIQPTAVPADGIALKNVRVEPSKFGAKWSVVSGTAIASRSTRFVFIDAYPKNADGMPLDHLAISNPGLAAGAQWDFTTTSFEGTFTDYYLLLRYRQQ